MYDVVGLGSCAVDINTKVNRFADSENKVNSDNIVQTGGGVTANNLIQTAKLNMKTAWCGMLGKDDLAKFLEDEFSKFNIDSFSHKVDKTQFTWIIIDESGERQIYVFPNATKEITPEIVETHFAETIKNSRHLHTEVSVIPLAAAIKGAEIAKENNVKVIVDIDGDPDYLLNDCGLGTKDEFDRLIELSDVLKLSKSAAENISEESDMNKVMEKLLQMTDVAAITLGSQGCYIGKGSEVVFCPSFKINAVDTTGAGDAFMGGLSYGIMKNMTLEEIGKFANACGAICCLNIGARSSGDLEEVNKFLWKQ